MKSPEKRPIEIPKSREGITPHSFARDIPAIMPVRDIRAPTERSIPLESMTMVIPRETIKRTDPWRTMLERFMIERKLGAIREKRINIPVKR
jgi:hypothetical protein